MNNLFLSTLILLFSLTIKGRTSSTQDYKEFLQTLVPGAQDDGKKHKAKIQSFREYHTENKVHFIVELTRDQMQKAEQSPGGLLEYFKLLCDILEPKILSLRP